MEVSVEAVLQGWPVSVLNKSPAAQAVGMLVALQDTPVTELNKSPDAQFAAETKLVLKIKSPKTKARMGKTNLYFFIYSNNTLSLCVASKLF